MSFLEAEQTYRELEAKLVRGELAENEFLAQVALLRLRDKGGRRWMISGQTGRWLVHDGQQWVFADPPLEEEQAALEAKAAEAVAAAQTIVTGVEDVGPAEGADAAEPIPPGGVEALAAEANESIEAAEVAETLVGWTPARREPRSPTHRLVTLGIAALVVIGCVVAGGISAWVLFLRTPGEATVAPTGSGPVALVETFTPRPATPTFTPTASPTPSRTAKPTITPTPTDTGTPTPTTSPTPTGEPTETTAPVQTYTVQAGETLSEIAARFGVSAQALADANGITNQALVRAGQVLVIPAATSGPAGSTVTATWTPLVLSTQAPTLTATPATTPTATSTATRTPTATASGPTPTPKPAATATPKPAVVSGKIAFAVWNAGLGKYELYISQIDGTGLNKLGTGFRQPHLRSDGGMLVANAEGAPDFLEKIVRMNPAGGEKTEISNYVEDSYPVWHPAGGSVAYSSRSWGDGNVRLAMIDEFTTKQWHWIPFSGREVQGEYPFWMGGGRIVYHGCRFWDPGSAECGLYWVLESGGTPTRLTQHESDWAPAGSGERVAFMSLRDGNYEIYTINMDGSGEKRLTSNTTADGLPTWSPDGKSIAFVSNRDGAWAIWVMDASGANQRKLFNLPGGGGYGSGDQGWTTERISWAP